MSQNQFATRAGILALCPKAINLGDAWTQIVPFVTSEHPRGHTEITVPFGFKHDPCITQSVFSLYEVNLFEKGSIFHPEAA